MKLKSYLVCGALLFAGAAHANADLLTVNLKARVMDVYDQGGVLGAAVTVGQSVNGSYTYDLAVPDSDTSPQWGHYAQWQGKIKVSIGAFEFETRGDASQWDSVVAVHPSDWPGSYQGFFRIMSWANQPLSNGASVHHMDVDFSDFSGRAPLNDALPTDAPVLTNYSDGGRIYIGGEHNGQYFGIMLRIESAALPTDESDLVISPGASTFIDGQNFDVALLLPPGANPVNLQASIDGMHAPYDLYYSCHIRPATADRMAIFCPDGRWRLPYPQGKYRVDFEVQTSDGRTLRNSVDWKLIR